MVPPSLPDPHQREDGAVGRHHPYPSPGSEPGSPCRLEWGNAGQDAPEDICLALCTCSGSAAPGLM